MRPLFHPQLVNGPEGDPALYVGLLHHRRALLFDAGELHAYPAGKLLKVSHLFISHAHMDHFIGFDQLVRLMLGRAKLLRVYGPAPLLDQVTARLAAYSWNLVQGYQERVVLEVNQVRGDRLERALLDCREGFRDPQGRQVESFSGRLCRESHFEVRAAVLDHKIPSMAFCLEEPRHVQILKDRLPRWRLQVGPWLRDLKEAILREEGDNHPVQVAPAHLGPRPLGWLRENLVRIAPGQRIGYVADAAYGEENKRRIVSLVRGADLLFIEAAFLHEDRERAAETAHLTALQAGRLAAEAGVKRMVPFHFSTKYTTNKQRLAAEAEEAFRAFTPGP